MEIEEIEDFVQEMVEDLDRALSSVEILVSPIDDPPDAGGIIEVPEPETRVRGCET